MSETGIGLAMALALLAFLFLAFAIAFAVKKEKACKLIGGFNSLTESQQARYDRLRLSQDYKKLFLILTGVMLLSALLCLWLHYWAFGGAMLAMLILIFQDFHWDVEKAFAKYKLDP